MLDIIQLVIVNTLILGSIYLLVSLGFSLICGVLRVFHLGYAYIFVMTTYLTWMLMKNVGLGLIPAIIGMTVVMFAFTVVIHKGIIRRYMAKEEYQLTALLLIAMIAAEVANYAYPPEIVIPYIPTALMPGTTTIGAATVSNQMIFGAIIAILLTGLFIVFFLKSYIGLAIRAISQDMHGSKIMGLNVERIFTYVIILSVIPPIIATLIVIPIWAVEPYMGWSYYNTAVIISVLGGLGNLRGTIIASYIIGFLHSFTSFIIGEPRFSLLFTLILVVVVLAVRPRGIARSEALW